MLGDPTKSSQGGIWPKPRAEARLDCFNDIVQLGKVLVMETSTANQFPNPFDGIELWTVRRQEMKSEMVSDFPAPFFVQAGVMIASIVDDHDNLPAAFLCDALDPSNVQQVRASNIPSGGDMTSLPSFRRTAPK